MPVSVSLGRRTSIHLSLSAERAADCCELRSFDAELALFDHAIEAYQRAATLTRNQYDAAIVPRADVEQANTQLASVRAQAIDVRLQRAQLERAVAVLIGEPSASLSLAAAPPGGDRELPPGRGAPDSAPGQPAHGGVNHGASIYSGHGTRASAWRGRN